MKKTNIFRKYSFDSYVFMALAAIELLMSFTFLGYIHIPPISVTFGYIPIIIAACLLDPWQSTAIGAVFGAASMYKACASYVMPTDRIFSPILSGSPIKSILLAVGARALFGLVTGLIFHVAKKQKHFRVWIAAATLLAPEIHALIVYISMILLFPETVNTYLSHAHLNISEIIVSFFCMALIEGLWTFYKSRMVSNFKNSIDSSCDIPYINTGKKNIFIAVFAAFIAIMMLSATFYFSYRGAFILRQHNINVSPVINSDLMHLQMQFMMAMLSLCILSLIALDMIYKYTSYQKFLGELDVITNVMGRRIFFNCCERAQTEFDPHAITYGWFLFIDADNFKTINDTLGHHTGDIVLKGIAASLKQIVGEYGIVGRIGGDEFAAMINAPLEKEILEKKLDRFLAEISGILPSPHKVSCSIGACRFRYPVQMTPLTAKTDDLLYAAKANGRACYVIGEYE